jgi:hypothetical protein
MKRRKVRKSSQVKRVKRRTLKKLTKFHPKIWRRPLSLKPKRPKSQKKGRILIRAL